MNDTNPARSAWTKPVAVVGLIGSSIVFVAALAYLFINSADLPTWWPGQIPGRQAHHTSRGLVLLAVAVVGYFVVLALVRWARTADDTPIDLPET